MESGRAPRVRSRLARLGTAVLIGAILVAAAAEYEEGPAAHRAVTRAPTTPATFPFSRSHDERRTDRADGLPRFWADGRPCSIGCRAAGAIPGWPLKPFGREHALRAGLNERRNFAFHVGVDIETKDGTKVYAVQSGRANILQASGPEERVRVGNFIYWHVRPRVRQGQLVEPYRTVVGRVMRTAGHLHLSELAASGLYLNPLRPGGRVLRPWRDGAPPVIGTPELRPDGEALIHAFDPQSFVQTVPYPTPVLAPAALAWRLFDRSGRRVGPLRFAYRGSQHLPARLDSLVWAPDAHKGVWQCFERHRACRPNWHYRLAGGLAPRLPRASATQATRLSVYAWDWAGNTTARDFALAALERRGH